MLYFSFLDLMEVVVCRTIKPSPYSVGRSQPFFKKDMKLVPIAVCLCQKLNHSSQSPLVGFSWGNLYLDLDVWPPGLKTNCSRYHPSAVVVSERNIISKAPYIG
jgi:hypothetical protein